MNRKHIAIFITIVVVFLIVYCYIWYNRINTINEIKNSKKPEQNEFDPKPEQNQFDLEPEQSSTFNANEPQQNNTFNERLIFSNERLISQKLNEQCERSELSESCFFCSGKATKVRILDPDASIPVDRENGELLVQLSEAEKMTLYSCEQCLPIAGTFRTSKWIHL